jgi:hypothetical protein
MFFFDTVNNRRPEDTDSDGLYDNLTPAIDLSGGSYMARGFIYLNAEQFETSGSGNVPSQTVMYAPAEPYIDSNNNGLYDSNEYFLDLDYPAGDPEDDYTPNAMRRVIDGFTRQDPSEDAAPDGKYNTDVNLFGVFYTNGVYNAEGNWTLFGSVIAKQGTQAKSLAGTPRIFFDERLIKGKWPPPELKLPRTIITVWETDM